MTKNTEQQQNKKQTRLNVFTNPEEIKDILIEKRLYLISFDGFNSLIPVEFFELIQGALERDKSLEHLVNQEYDLLDKKTKRVLYLKFKEEFEK